METLTRELDDAEKSLGAAQVQLVHLRDADTELEGTAQFKAAPIDLDSEALDNKAPPSTVASSAAPTTAAPTAASEVWRGLDLKTPDGVQRPSVDCDIIPAPDVLTYSAHKHNTTVCIGLARI